MSARQRSMMKVGLLIVLLGGAASPLLRGQAAPPATPQNELQRLAEAKVAVATRAVSHMDELYKMGRAGAEDLPDRVRWSRRLAEGRIGLASEPAAKVAIAEAFVNQTRQLRELAKRMFEAGMSGGMMTVFEMEYEVLDAETMLAELKAR